jgi:Chaperone of endosialidase
MDQPRHFGFVSRSTRFAFTVVLAVAVLIASTVRPAGAQSNTALGTGALSHVTTGSDDTALGFNALNSTAVGIVNTATGENALFSDTTGCHNTATGVQSLVNNTTGNYNVAIGYNAGSNLTTGDNNIDIDNVGLAGEAGIIRIGTKGVQTRTFIAGINNAPVSIGSPVLVNANGRLGIEVSSARFKRDIRDMGAKSDRLMKLRPVTFRYKDDSAGTLQYGLIAEEVARVYPELVIYGADGKAQSVAYHLLPAMLLNEMQKQIRENQRKLAQIAALQQRLVAQEKQISALQRETARIDMLTARLNVLEQQQARTARPERLAATSAAPMPR